jgi:hypothetical protein
MRDHSLIEELLAADALGGLAAGDRAVLDGERGTHGECEECDRLEAGFAETAGRLGFALDPVPISERTVDEILRRSPAPVPAPTPLSRPAGRRALLAAAIALVVLLGAIAIGNVTSGGEITVAFTGETGVHMEMAFTPGEPGARLDGSGLRRLPTGRVYELWAIRAGSPIPETCFAPNLGRVSIPVPKPVQAGDVMAVTVESDICPAAPTTQPILTADLSRAR